MDMRERVILRVPSVLGVALGLLGGCSEAIEDEGVGALSVVVESESVIRDGLKAGDGRGQVADGWSVSFDRYLVALGHVELSHVGSEGEVELEPNFVVDLTQVAASGEELWAVPELASGAWEFRYAVTSGGDAEVHKSAAGGNKLGESSYLIEGTLQQAEGVSCPPAALASPGEQEPAAQTSGGNACFPAEEIRFQLSVEAPSAFGPCEVDGIPGVNIPNGGDRTVALSIHGDHLFFNGFPTGTEGGVTRFAQWLADCDLDLDGTVTTAELAEIELAQLPEIDERFQLGGAPVESMHTVLEYVSAQLMTQGHFQGEGECPVNGQEHDHGHEADEHDHEEDEHDHED